MRRTRRRRRPHLSMPPAPLVLFIVIAAASIGALVARRWRRTPVGGSSGVRLLAEHVAENVSVHDESGFFRMASAGFGTLVGVAPDALIGRHPREFAHPDDDAVVAAAWSRPMRAGGSTTIMWRCRRAAGGYAWLETTARRAPAEVASLGAIVCASRDITERKQIEDALRESEQRFRSTLEALRLVAVALDRDGRVIFANDALSAITGWTRSELLGQSWFDVAVPRGDRSRSLFFGGIVTGDVPGKYDGELLCRDGRRRTIDWDNTILRASDGAIVGMASLGADVTDRRHEETALKLLQSITLGISSAQDVNRALAVALESLCETSGWSYGEAWLPAADGEHVERTTSYAAIGVNASPLVESGADEVLGRGDGLAGHAWKAKAVVWVPDMAEFNSPKLRRRAAECGFRAAVALPILAGKDVVAVLVFFMDRPRATDVRHTQMIEVVLNQVGSVIGRRLAQRQYEAEILRARDDAEAASRAKSEFLSRMSHELRTPLNSVIGFSNVMRKNKDGRLNSGDLAFLERIVANGQHLLTLVNNVLDIARVEAGRLTIARSLVDVGQLIQDVVAQMEGQPHSPAVRLSAEVPPNMRPISSDGVLLRQVLINLIGNALRFTHEGSVVVAATVGEDGTPARIEVRDTGIGISPDRQGAIFDPFEQADSATHRSYGGTGLGLSISRAICDALNYGLSVESEVGRGSTFTVSITGVTQQTELSPQRSGSAAVV
jgi:PAS domain S-box-containing protein